MFGVKNKYPVFCLKSHYFRCRPERNSIHGSVRLVRGDGEPASSAASWWALTAAMTSRRASVELERRRGPDPAADPVKKRGAAGP